MEENITLKIECSHCKGHITKNIQLSNLTEESRYYSRPMDQEIVYSMEVNENCPLCSHQWNVISVSEYPEGGYTAWAE